VFALANNVDDFELIWTSMYSCIARCIL